MFCPACGAQLMQKNINTDWLLCVYDGQMSSLLAVDLQGLPYWSALIDIRAEQYKRELALMRFKYAEQASQFAQVATGAG